MLILERCRGEKIKIGDDIEVVVTQIRNEWGRYSVKLGISAPKHLRVDREEIYLRRKEGLEPKPKRPKPDLKKRFMDALWSKGNDIKADH